MLQKHRYYELYSSWKESIKHIKASLLKFFENMNGKLVLNNFASNHGKCEIALLERNNLAKFSFKPLKRKKIFHVSKHLEE